MMSCLEKLLVFGNLNAVPAASPFFLLLLGISLWYSVKPCWYCLITLTIYYAATSPDSPFVQSPAPVLDSNAGPATPLPIPYRSWTPWNGGRLFDPQLLGYLPIASVDSSISTPTSSCPMPSPEAGVDNARNETEAQCTTGEWERAGIEEKERLRHRTFEERGELPPGYYDLRWRGLGFVLDLGWRRTDEGMKWEGEVGMLPPGDLASTAGQDGKKGRVEEETIREATTVEAASPRVPDPPEESISATRDDKGQVTEVMKEGRGWKWSRISFAGDL